MKFRFQNRRDIRAEVRVNTGQPLSMRYAISLAVMIITVGLKRLNDVWGGPAIPFFLFFLPLLMIAWFAGFGPSMASALPRELPCSLGNP